MAWDSLTWFCLVVASYLIGGIPTAYLATRLLTGGDIRHVGDRNPGAANVYRNVGPKAGVLVGAIDVIKGGLAVVLVRIVADSTPVEMIAGVAVLAGHNWPVHLGLRGGRGAATAIGRAVGHLAGVGYTGRRYCPSCPVRYQKGYGSNWGVSDSRARPRLACWLLLSSRYLRCGHSGTGGLDSLLQCAGGGPRSDSGP